jgi:hypothetical protein
MQEAASDVLVEFARELPVEGPRKRVPGAQERDEQVAAAGIFIGAGGWTAQPPEAVAAPLHSGLQELNERAMDGDDGKSFSLIGGVFLKHSDRVQIPQGKALMEVARERLPPWRGIAAGRQSDAKRPPIVCRFVAGNIDITRCLCVFSHFPGSSSPQSFTKSNTGC